MTKYDKDEAYALGFMESFLPFICPTHLVLGDTAIPSLFTPGVLLNFHHWAGKTHRCDFYTALSATWNRGKGEVTKTWKPLSSEVEEKQLWKVSTI